MKVIKREGRYLILSEAETRDLIKEVFAEKFSPLKTAWDIMFLLWWVLSLLVEKKEAWATAMGYRIDFDRFSVEIKERG